MLDFLPSQLKLAILNSFKTIYEVRIRVDKAVLVKGNNGLEVDLKEIKFLPLIFEAFRCN